MSFSTNSAFGLTGSLNSILLNSTKNALHKSVLTGNDAQQAGINASNAAIAEQLSSHASALDTANENVQDSLFWMAGRDTGMNEQYAIVQEGRDLAVRASNEATMTDRDRAIMNAQIQAGQAEMTRIGLTNEVHGHPTLADYGEVQEVKIRTEIVKVPVEGADGTTPVKPQIDVIWVMDRTGSMSDDIEHLGTDAPKMFKALEDKGFDVHMAAESFEKTLDSNGSTTFRDNVADFQNDVNNILSHVGGEEERGLNGIQQALTKFQGDFRPDATKVTVLISDMNCYDIGHEYIAADDKLAPGPEAEAFRQKTADMLKAAGSELYVVGDKENPDGTWAYDKSGWKYTPTPGAVPGPDDDYVDVVKKVGAGVTMPTDFEGKWVDEVTKNFVASVDNNEKKKTGTTIDKVVETREVTTSYKLKDEWDLGFQVGPASQDHLVEHFHTMTAETSGFAKADLSTTENAQSAIDTADKAIDFLNNAKVQIGGLQEQFKSILNGQSIQSINEKASSLNSYNAAFSYGNISMLGLVARSYRT